MNRTRCPKCDSDDIATTHIASEPTIRRRCLNCFTLWHEEPLRAVPTKEPTEHADIIVLREPAVA